MSGDIMVRFKLRAALAGALLAALMLSPAPALAWGPEGHNIIARVAYSRLSLPMQAKFDAILAKGNGLHYSYTDDEGHAQSCSASTIGQAANWADCVRYGGPLKATYGEHFDDMPYCPKPPAPPPPKSSYCPGGVCASAAIPKYIAQLKATGTSDYDRAAALAFLLHFVGDSHQPLHNIDNADDHGGGKVQIEIAPTQPNGHPRRTALHKVWDGDVIKWVFSTEAMAVNATTNRANAKAALWTSSDFNEAATTGWSIATHKVAVRAYDKVSPPPVCDVTNGKIHRITQAYFGTFNTDVQDQLAMASVRLGDILEQALAAAP